MIDLYMICMDLKNNHSNFKAESLIIIKDIYQIINNPSDKTRKIIKGWKESFRYIYGDVEENLSSNNKLNITEIIKRYHIEPIAGLEPTQAQMLFYSIQTYFSVLIKVIMKEILSEHNDDITNEGIIWGEFAQIRGITNYCNPDWYSWPVNEMNNGFAGIIQRIKKSVDNYRSLLSVEEFAKNNNYDYIKQMYEAIIPKELRHALGEYYTPDWLAEETLKTALSFESTNINQHFIDPTCGSGTFLFRIIIEKKEKGATIEDILNSVVGIDINPLAVLTAKTNYLLAVIDLLDGKTEIEIPVYNADIVRFHEPAEDTAQKGFLDQSGLDARIQNSIYYDRKKASSLEKAEIIVGNPPWVNWEYMPEEYRISSQHLWLDYNLFSATGRDLSFSKEDISVLITYVVLDKLLQNGGILAFVIRQGVFKSAQNGVGFRRFQLKDECGIRVLRVDDLSKIRAFDNVANSTALVYLRKGEDTIYPVPYLLWEKRKDLKRLSINSYAELRAVKDQLNIKKQRAMPAVEDDPASIWLTADMSDLESIRKVLGKNNYKARTGVFTGGANAVYWLRVSKKVGDDIEISNIVERAKRKTEKVTKVIEPEYVFPMIKGSSVKRWNVTYDTYLLCPHTAETRMWPVKQERLKEETPKTFEYLCNFKNDLDERKGFAGWEKEIQKQEFQAVLRVGEYTFSKYKVVWKYIASEFICAVIGSVHDQYLGKKVLIPNEKIMYVSTDNENEAYYLCGVLSSTIVAKCVKSYMNPTCISAHVLDKLNIPEYDPRNYKHIEIARICKEGHVKNDINAYINDLDSIVSTLYT